MRNILVLGAGRSSSSLIQYLLQNSQACEWQVTVGDAHLQVAQDKVQNHPRGKAVRFDTKDAEAIVSAIGSADLVISLLPANLHPWVAIRCLALKKHLFNASYVSDEMKVFHDEAYSKGLLFLNECGLDPGIDHMSAMQVIDRIHHSGGKVTSFESFTGGLIAPDTDPQNPWRYKFTWNPKNVVMAGQSTARYLQHGKFKYIPYQQLFKRTTPVHVSGYGDYEGYANRDSLKYIETYNLRDVKTMLRGTLRNRGFCKAWDIFVQLGCCDDSVEMENVFEMTHRSFLETFMEEKKGTSAKEKLCDRFGLAPDAEAIRYLEWSGLFSNEPVGIMEGSPAKILEHILNKKWKLNPEDKDQIVMWHRFVYELGGSAKEIQASLVATGTDSVYTAMAQTVGLPLGIVAKLFLQNRISSKGVVIPTLAEFYNPVLAELQQLGIVFREESH
jgi:saccharopine dehydrogenase-like NADP-dependent oxidoreductase